MSLSPPASTVKQTGQELCEIFKFWSFLQSKSVNNVCRLLQLRPSNPDSLPGRRLWTSLEDPLGRLGSLELLPQMKIPSVAIDSTVRAIHSLYVVDMNECDLSTPVCPVGASCVNTFGSFYCVTGVVGDLIGCEWTSLLLLGYCNTTYTTNVIPTNSRTTRHRTIGFYRATQLC